MYVRGETLYTFSINPLFMPKSASSSPPRSAAPLPMSHWIKVAVIFILLLCATAYLAYESQRAGSNYLSLLMVKPEVVRPLIELAIALFLFFVMSGIAAVLLDPAWAAILAFFGVGIVTAVIFGFSLAPLCVSLFFLVLAIGYLFSVRKLQRNQIRFTTHPLANAKRVLSLAIAILISASYAFGWSADAARRQFVLPPEFKQAFVSFVVTQGKVAVQKQLGDHPTKVQIDSLNQQLQTTAEKTFTGIESGFKQPFIMPVLLASMIFTVLSILLFPIMYLSLGVISLLLWLTRLAKVTHMVTEQREVSTISL
jgi:hypothetical protein